MSGKPSTLADNEARLAFWLLMPTVAVVLAFVVFPMVWNLWLSFKPVSLADLRGESLWRLNFTLSNYSKVFTDPEFITVLVTTLFYTVSGSLLSILLGLMAALLVQGEFAGRGTLRAFLISPYIAPVVAVTFTWSFILDPQLGIINWLGLNQGLISQPIPFFSQRLWEVNLLGLTLRIPWPCLPSSFSKAGVIFLLPFSSSWPVCRPFPGTWTMPPRLTGPHPFRNSFILLGHN